MQRITHNKKTAIVVGAGGLGCPVALGLAEGGVDHVVLVDDDAVELSNLQRQVLYGTADVGRAKVDVAAERLGAQFPDITLETRQSRLTADTIDTLLAPANSDGLSVVVDATDDPSARFLINDWALEHGVHAVLGGVSGFVGQVIAVAGGCGPCFRCLFESVPAPGEVGSCALDGVVGALAGVVGFLQAERALALLGGDVAGQTGFLTTLDGLSGRIRHIPLPVGAACDACGGLVARRRVDDAPSALAALRDAPPGGLLDLVGPASVMTELSEELAARGATTGLAGSADNLHRLVIRAPANTETPHPKKGHALWQ